MDAREASAAPVGSASLAEARRLYEANGLPFPPIPPELVPRIRRLREWLYGTREASPSVYFLDAYLHELEGSADAGPDDFVLLGHAGHGVESYALHYYLVRGPLGVLVQVAWGTPSTDRAAAGRTLAHHYAGAERLFQAAEAATRRGALRPPCRLVVCVSDFRLRGQWAVLDPNAGGSEDPWRYERADVIWDKAIEAVNSIGALPSRQRDG